MRLLGMLLTVVPLCSCQPLPTPQNYLDRPFFNFTASNGVCQQVVAVDGQRQGWKSDQCNGSASGYLQTRVLTPAEFAQIEAAFAALPPQPDPSCDGNFLPASTITYLRRGTADSDITWTACVVNQQLAPPYLEPVNLLTQFADTP